MRILLTNDDGVRAPGIVALHDALTGNLEPVVAPLADEVFVIAPETVQSASSHGVTFQQPLMVKETLVAGRMRGIGVDGRPADCVKVALAALWPDRFGAGSRPDLLVSGMNAGANVGINVIYSGTIAAAIEAAFLGVPAIAVSLHLGKGRPDFATGARHARQAIERVLATGLLTPHSCITINVPITELDDDRRHVTPPLVVCPMNTHGLNDRYERRESPRGDVYYWAAGGGFDFHTTDDDTDVHRLFQRQITVTPLMYDLTDGRALSAWRAGLAGA